MTDSDRSDSDATPDGTRSLGRRSFLRAGVVAGVAGTGLSSVGTVAASETSGDSAPDLVLAWQRAYGGRDRDTAVDFVHTDDGGFLTVGVTESFGAGVADIWAVKTDAGGTRQWDRTYGGPNVESPGAVTETPDGGFLFAGVTTSYGSGASDAWLFKTDDAGRMLWDETFGTGEEDVGVDVTVTSAGAYLLSYTSSPADSETTTARLAETDSEGAVVWDHGYGTEGATDEFVETIETGDGGYLSAGRRRGIGPGPQSGWLVKTDTDGQTLWERTLGGEQTDTVSAVVETSDGNYLLAGSSDPFGDREAWLVATDSVGSVQWNSLLGGRAATDVIEVAGGYLLCGVTDDVEGTDRSGYLVRTDADGIKQWDLAFGDAHRQVPVGLSVQGEGYVLAGRIDRGDADGKQVWLARLAPLAFPTAQGPPTSLDDDPLLEDVDGSGEGNIFDALTYYNNRESDYIRDNPRLFDFDGDETAGDIFDTLALYNELS